MTTLLLDLGNSALKWATSDRPEEPSTFVHGGRSHLPAELRESWLALRPDRVMGCMVASEALAMNITNFFNKHGVGWSWLHSEASYSGQIRLVNGYRDHHQLGSDRWYAAIGAVGLYPGQPLLVIHLGTATTVDTVLRQDDHMLFRGGRILPGPSMMYSSLVRETRCRPSGMGQISDFPADTDAAISTGVLEAHLGVIESARLAAARQGPDPTIVFAGGAAPLLAPYIQERYPRAERRHNLVLRGLALAAEAGQSHA